MSLHVAGIQAVAGGSVAYFWLPDAEKAGERRVSCVSVVRDLAEAAACRGGEVALIAPGGDACETTELVDMLVARQAAAVLVPRGLVSSAELGRMRRLAARCNLSVGLLANDVDTRALANSSSSQ